MRVVSVSLKWSPRRVTDSDDKTGWLWDLPGAAPAATVLKGHHDRGWSVKSTQTGW